MKSVMYSKKSGQEGQTLVLIFFVMLLAMAIGLGASETLVTTLQSFTQTHTQYRAQAVTEAALERLLLKPTSELAEYINFNSCGSECVLTIVNDDGTTDTATITLSFIGNSAEPFLAKLTQNTVAEVNLTGYPNNGTLDVCWQSPTAGDLPSVAGMIVSGSVGNYQVSDFAYNSAGTSYGANGFDTATGGGGYDHCFTLNVGSDPVLLRLHSIYNSVDAYVIPAASTTLPTQGILLSALGTSVDSTYQVAVLKTESFLPLVFDYALWSKSTTQPLSN